jgi:hypothetical protein
MQGHGGCEASAPLFEQREDGRADFRGATQKIQHAAD